MNIQEILKLVEVIPYAPPGQHALSCLERFSRKRSANLSDISLPSDGTCAWCNSRPITPPRKKYCGDVCQVFAEMWCNPQSPRTKAWLLIHRQSCACTLCGEDFEEQIVERILHLDKYLKRCRRDRPDYWHPSSVTYFLIGSNTADLWEVDHRIPIFRGGQGIGLDNVQVVCTACHRNKTAMEKSA